MTALTRAGSEWREIRRRCMDGKAEYPIGDVNTQHCLEIYNAPHYRQLREKTFTRADARLPHRRL